MIDEQEHPCQDGRIGFASSAGMAFAQSSLTLYGNFDVAIDNVHKGQGYIGDNTYLTQTIPTLAGRRSEGGRLSG